MCIEEILKTRPNVDGSAIDQYVVNSLENYIDKLEKVINSTTRCNE